MSLTTTQHSVTIGDQYCKVYVSQRGLKTVWRAGGEICGRYIEEKGRSARGALQAWVNHANEVYRSR